MLMREWAAPFKPVRQRTVRDETTKDKAGTLPISLYQNQAQQEQVDAFENLFCIDQN